MIGIWIIIIIYLALVIWSIKISIDNANYEPLPKRIDSLVKKYPNCKICQDSPCEREVCRRSKYEINGCESCPAIHVCNEKYNDITCSITKDKIELLVNDRKEIF
jgi:hypothetical protein